MDRHPGKRGPKLLVKKSNGGGAEGEENAQFCKRIGCSGRIKYPQTTKTGASFSTSERNGTVTDNPGNSKTKLPSVSKSRLSRDLGVRSSPSSLNKSKPGSVGEAEKQIPIAPLASRSSALRPLNSRGVSCGQRNTKVCSVSDSPQRYQCTEPNSTVKKLKKKRIFDGESSARRRSNPMASMDIQWSPSSSTGSSSSSFSSQRPRNTCTKMAHSSRLSDRSFRISDNGSAFSLGRRRTGNSHSHGSVRFTSSARWDLLHQSDINGASEMLLAAERMEQDEELTHEEVLLEMSLFLGSLALYDRHRDLRLDIDSMSYEELLALGERMGTVSTPLSEEELSKCLQRSVFRETSCAPQTAGFSGDVDDSKCSICQEEYVAGEEIGVLSECRHGYHTKCISQWLRLKNWCPVCKASAAPSP